MAIPKPPGAVTFDCWSTLLDNADWDLTVEVRAQALSAIAGEYGVPVEVERAQQVIDASWRHHLERWRSGEICGPRGAAEWCLAHLGIPSVEALNELTEAIAGTAERVGTFAIPGARDALELVRAAGIPTALICDTGFTPGARVRRFLGEHRLVLDHYLFSDEVGTPKPDPRIFEAALAATGAQPGSAVHIGDLRRTDIAGARGAGMATIRFAGVHDDGWQYPDSQGAEADAVLREWSALGGLLGL